MMRYYLTLGTPLDGLDSAPWYYTRQDAVSAFCDYAREGMRTGLDEYPTGAIHAAPSRDELNEYPDWILSIGPRGGVRVDRA